MEEWRWVLVNVAKLWSSLLFSFGLIFYFVAPQMWIVLVSGLLGIATVLFVGGYFLAKKSSEKRSP